MDNRWRKVGVHTRWVKDAKITESVYGDGDRRRFTATVCGWSNWKIWEGDVRDISVPSIIAEVENIRERIRSGDESIFAKNEDFLFVYGTLMSGEPGQKDVDVIQHLELVSDASMQGSLFDLGLYPGLVLDVTGVVKGELYRIKAGTVRDVFTSLDEFERYDESAPAESLYIRSLVQIDDPHLDAWAYIYNRPTGNAPRIASGKWRGYRSATMDKDS